MTSITSQLKATCAPTAPSRPAAASAPQEATPKESFTASSAPPAPWLQKPAVESSTAQKPTPGQKHGLTAGKAVLLGVGCLAAGAGVATAMLGSAQAAPPQAPVQAQTQTSRHEKKAVENLSYLNQVAQKEGGGLKIDGTSVMDKLFNTQREANPQQASNALRSGANVYFFESQGDEPVTIRSFEQLTEVTRDLKERVAQTQIEQGVKSIGEGLQRAGENVRDKIGEIFR